MQGKIDKMEMHLERKYLFVLRFRIGRELKDIKSGSWTSGGFQADNFGYYFNTETVLSLRS